MAAGPGPICRRWERSDSASMRAISSGWSNGRAITSSAPASSSEIRSSSEPVAATARTGTSIGGLAERSIVTTSATVTGGATWSIITRL